MIFKFISELQACTANICHYRYQHPVLFCLCCALYYHVCSRCDRQKCHYLLNLEYDPCDILLSIVNDKELDSSKSGI
jgi:hypothetical protein